MKSLKRINRFLTLVIGEFGTGMLVQAAYLFVPIAIMTGVSWLIGNAVRYWTGWSATPQNDFNPEIATGMLAIMGSVVAVTLVFVIAISCQWIAKRWRESAVDLKP